MPVSSHRATGQPTAEEARLRPYVFHGVHLSPEQHGTHAVGDCPFCGREGKFSVDVTTGLWRCWGCGGGRETGGGNALVFIRLLHEQAVRAVSEPFLAAVAADRRLLCTDAVVAWGVGQAADGALLIPGYNTEGEVTQLYRRVRVQDKGGWVWRLLPTPGVWTEGKGHGLHLPHGDLDPECPYVYVCEGPWDGMALWEAARGSDIAPCQILAVPGCTTWRDEWTAFCRGKRVTLLYDSDHPHSHVPGGRESCAGRDGMMRVAKRLSGVAAMVRYLQWGPDGYDPSKPSGYDLRDALSQGTDHVSRQVILKDTLGLVTDAPHEWFSAAATSTINGHNRASIEALPCSTFAECETAWRAALHWRQDLNDALAVLLAVCASTQQAGNQLFLDLISSPGSAKTTLCKGLLVSANCVHLENATKLISGYKKPGDTSKDCSFLARANGKTWVTCEFDVLASSPQYRDLMGKVRRIFDGETSATYGNSDEDRVYAALRTPWIRAGTHKMVDHDQSQLGDRFLRFVISDPVEEEKRNIARRAIRSERAAMLETANATSGSVLDQETRRAHALTGGYVDWLRAHAEEELAKVDVPITAEDRCIDLAELSADLRARPTWEDRYRASPNEASESKELPTRLARQFIRLATCLAVVLNKRCIDNAVLRIVRKVALDTAAGNTLNMVQWLSAPNPKTNNTATYQQSSGLLGHQLEQWTGMTSERLLKYLTFLRKINVVEWREMRQGQGAWYMTQRVAELYERVVRPTL